MIYKIWPTFNHVGPSYSTVSVLSRFFIRSPFTAPTFPYVSYHQETTTPTHINNNMPENSRMLAIILFVPVTLVTTKVRPPNIPVQGESLILLCVYYSCENTTPNATNMSCRLPKQRLSFRHHTKVTRLFTPHLNKNICKFLCTSEIYVFFF